VTQTKTAGSDKDGGNIGRKKAFFTISVEEQRICHTTVSQLFSERRHGGLIEQRLEIDVLAVKAANADKSPNKNAGKASPDPSPGPPTWKLQPNLRTREPEKAHSHQGQQNACGLPHPIPVQSVRASSEH
jgi:hypothetical protein